MTRTHPGISGDQRERALVLVVDDDPMIVAMVASILPPQGFDVVDAASVAAGRDQLRAHDVDVVLLDVVLPDGSGLELCTWLREQPAFTHLPVVVLTGSDDDQVIGAAFGAGATDFLRKPIEPEILVHRVRFALRASRTVRDLEASRASLAEAQAIARVGSFEFDVATDELTVSDQAAVMLGLGARRRTTRDQLVAAFHPDDRARVGRLLDDTIADTSAAELSVVHRLREGASRTRWVSIRAVVDRGPDGRAWRLRGTAQDVTDARRHEEAIAYLATHDPVSGLLNRDGFERVAAGALGRAQRHDERLAIVLLGVAPGTPLQAGLGVDRTARLLRQAGDRLAGTVRGATEERDAPLAIARWGSSAFALLYTDVDAAHRAEHLARSAVRSLATPFDLDDRRIGLAAQAGVAVFPDDAVHLQDLEQHAEIALRSLTPNDRGVVRRYEPRLRVDWELELELEHDLRAAIESEQLELYFQPQVHPDATVASAEALLRWTHPVHGPIPPDRFIPLAEATGLIVPLGRWVVDAAIAELAVWHRAGATHLRVAINVSAAQLGDARLAEALVGALERRDLPGSAVDLELTETVLLGDTHEVRSTLDALRATGVALSMDDVGTGFASLSVLSTLSLDQLKIDRTFVWHLDQPRTLAIVRAIVALGQGLGLTLVAEGVETAEQAQLLIDEGCDLLQGYHYARPLSAAGFRALVGIEGDV